MKGLFDLLGVADLCAKLEHDYKRVKANGADVFAAFDFLVTAWHLLEWKFPGNKAKGKREALVAQHPILGVCEHLAVAGKHYEPNNPNLQSVQSSERDSIWKRGFWAPGFWAQGVWKDDLVVQLSGPARAAYGDQMTVPQIADRVMEFWHGPGGCSPATVVAGSST